MGGYSAIASQITNIRYADDMMLFAKSLVEVEDMLALLKEELANIGLEMHESKTKIMTSFNETNINFIDVDGLLLEVLPDGKAHKYLGGMLSCSDARGKGEVANESKLHGEHFTSIVGG